MLLSQTSGNCCCCCSVPQLNTRRVTHYGHCTCTCTSTCTVHWVRGLRVWPFSLGSDNFISLSGEWGLLCHHASEHQHNLWNHLWDSIRKVNCIQLEVPVEEPSLFRIMIPTPPQTLMSMFVKNMEYTRPLDIDIDVDNMQATVSQLSEKFDQLAFNNRK